MDQIPEFKDGMPICLLGKNFNQWDGSIMGRFQIYVFYYLWESMGSVELRNWFKYGLMEISELYGDSRK